MACRFTFSRVAGVALLSCTYLPQHAIPCRRMVVDRVKMVLLCAKPGVRKARRIDPKLLSIFLAIVFCECAARPASPPPSSRPCPCWWLLALSAASLHPSVPPSPSIPTSPSLSSFSVRPAEHSHTLVYPLVVAKSRCCVVCASVCLCSPVYVPVIPQRSRVRRREVQPGVVLCVQVVALWRRMRRNVIVWSVARCT
jgi:hypothetical protein